MSKTVRFTQTLSKHGEVQIQEISSTPEAFFLVDLFQHLNDAKIFYSVLRHYENLPKSTAGHDLDVLVAPESIKRAFHIVCEVAKVHGGRLISYYRRTAVISRLCGKDRSLWWGVAIDLFPDMEYWGFPYYDAAAMLKNSTRWRDIPVVSVKDFALSAFLKECLYTGNNRKGYASIAAKEYQEGPHYFDPILQKYFGPGVAKKFSGFFTQRAKSPSIRSLCRDARKALLLKNLSKDPIWALRRKVSCHFQRLSSIFKPAGFVVALLGTDGSGKSTIIEHIQPPLCRAVHNQIKYEHMRPNLLPSLARLFGQHESECPVTNPHGSKPSGYSGSLLRITYYSLDYIFGYWIKVFPRLVKRPTIWLFDRYFYDYLIDPRRSRLSLPKWVVKFYSLAIPKPDLILCLAAEPETIYARKPELAIEEIQRQVQDLRDFCESTPRAVWIDTDCLEEVSIDRALEAITSRMAVRYTGQQ